MGWTGVLSREAAGGRGSSLVGWMMTARGRERAKGEGTMGGRARTLSGYEGSWIEKMRCE